MENQKLSGYPSIDKPWLKYYTKEAIETPITELSIYEYLLDCNSQGRLPIAFIVPEESINNEMAKNELFELCKAELPEYAQPIDFIFIDKLPLTPIGKVDYRKLEEMAKKQR